MARKRSGLSQARGFLYGLSRLLGDISAVSRGIKGYCKKGDLQDGREGTVGKPMGKLLK